MDDSAPSASDGRYRVYQADSRRLTDELSKEFSGSELDGLIDATVTSPPYADIKDYGYDEQIGKGDSYAQYLDDLRQVFKGVYDVTAEDGSLWVNVNDRQKAGRVVDIPGDIVDTLENLEDRQSCPVCSHGLCRDRERGVLECTNYDAHEGVEEDNLDWAEIREDEGKGKAIYYDPSVDSWVCDRKVIWNKQKSNDERDGMRNVAEYVLVFKKSEEFSINEDARIYDPTQLKQWWISDTYNYSPDGATYPNVWDIPAEITGGWGDDNLDHEAVFPPALVERMIEMATTAGDTVLDPFAGTGTTLAVGDLMGRNTIGFELNQDYIDLHPSRFDSIERYWDRADHLTLEERKQRYAQATWALRHHGYVKWLFTTLRSEAGDIAGAHRVWNALTDASVEEAFTSDVPEGAEALARAVAATHETDSPVTSFLSAAAVTEPHLRERLQTDDTPPEKVAMSDVLRLLEQEQASLLEQGLELTEAAPIDILAALLEELATHEEVVLESDFLDDAAADVEVTERLDAKQYTETAQALVDAGDTPTVFQRLAVAVPSEALEEVVRSLEGSTQATLGSWGEQDDQGPERATVLAGALQLAILYSTALVGKVESDSFEPIEPLIDLQQAYDDRFGIHGVVLQPENATGTPTGDADTVSVTHTFLFESPGTADDVGEVLETAITHLLAEQPSSNAKKLRKHKLDPEMEWLAGKEFAERIEKGQLAYDPDAFYLYSKGHHHRYRSSFDSEGRLWAMCTSKPGVWADEYCSRTVPAIISPLALAIEEATPDRPRYAIVQVNDIGDAARDETPTGNETLF